MLDSAEGETDRRLTLSTHSLKDRQRRPTSWSEVQETNPLLHW